jgi:DnaJ-class molecular chaperone
MHNEQTYYEILGITYDAGQKEIKAAYRRLSFKYHPDRNLSSPAANEMMQKINLAYATLSDPMKKHDYDIPFGYCTVMAQFKAGDRVVVNSHSKSPYRNHTGVVANEPVKDSFRFWYIVRFELQGFSTTNRFAEEELSKT